MKISSKLNELKLTDLNCNVFDVYSYDGLSMQDLLCQFFTKINECIKVSNETIDLASWLVNEGLKIEVVKKLMLWLEDGTLENLINVNLFNTLNTKIENIESYKNDIGVNLNKFNVIGDGVTDDIVNINKALLFAKDNSINIVSFEDKTYFITDTIEVPDNIILNMNNTKIKYLGTSNNKPAIRLSNNSKIINKCSIEMDDAPGSANKCWILLGDFQTGQGISNVYIDNVELLGGFNNCNGISIAGDTNSVVINKVDCSNTTKPGRVIMAHWGNFNDHYVNGGSYIHVNNYKPTTHPHNIKINEVFTKVD